MSEQIYLSRRNLLTLLSKLDRQRDGESTACTVIKFRNEADPYIQSMDTIAVTAVEDDVYYAKRNAGPMHPDDEVAIATRLYSQAMGLPTAELCGYVFLGELPLGHHVYTGEGVGKGARELFGMDDLDGAPATIIITAPNDTYSISDSFWRGLLDDSLNKLGDKDSAHRKLKFEGPQQFHASFSAYITRHFLTRKG